jgi:hypothetical protein
MRHFSGIGESLEPCGASCSINASHDGEELHRELKGHFDDDIIPGGKG